MVPEGKKQPSAVALAPRCRFIVGVEEEFFCKSLRLVGTFLHVEIFFFWKAVGHVLLVVFFKLATVLPTRWWPQCRQGWFIDVASAWLVFWWPGVAEVGFGGRAGFNAPFAGCTANFLSLLFSYVDFSFFTMLISFFNVWMHRHGLMCLKKSKKDLPGRRLR